MIGLLLLGLTAWAQDDMVGPMPAEPAPIVPQDVVATPADLVVPDPREAEYAGVVYSAAQALNIKPAFVQACRDGLALLYQRDYRGSRVYFQDLERAWPGTGIAGVADVLIWQARMLENSDFEHDQAYRAASAVARARLEESLAKPGNDAWEHFMMVGVSGVEAIHTARQEHYLQALTLAFEAIDHMETVRRLAPDFTDLRLADGLYNYWRTVITDRSKLLPSFGDHKAEGIAQIEEVERAGAFLSEAATLALAYTWIEEDRFRDAVQACLRNGRRYPSSVINNVVMAQTYIMMKRYDTALAALDRIAEEDPSNKRMHYYRGLALLRAERIAEAEAPLERYLGFDYLEDWQRSMGSLRLGQVRAAQGRPDEAEALYKQAIRIDGNKAAKKALDDLKKSR